MLPALRIVCTAQGNALSECPVHSIWNYPDAALQKLSTNRSFPSLRGLNLSGRTSYWQRIFLRMT